MTEPASKVCARCKLEKSLAEFARKRARDYQPYCRSCQAEYKREHYRQNKDRYLAAVKKRREGLLAVLREAKNRPCLDCGVLYPYFVMDLDHRQGEEKLGNFTEAVHWGALTEATLRVEIAKCDVVCANCHRIRTHLRNQYLNKAARQRKKDKTDLESLL